MGFHRLVPFLLLYFSYTFSLFVFLSDCVFSLYSFCWYSIVCRIPFGVYRVFLPFILFFDVTLILLLFDFSCPVSCIVRSGSRTHRIFLSHFQLCRSVSRFSARLSMFLRLSCFSIAFIFSHWSSLFCYSLLTIFVIFLVRYSYCSFSLVFLLFSVLFYSFLVYSFVR